MKKLLLLVTLLWFAMTLWAQSPTENPKQKISEVKQAEGQYIYADQTSATVEKALEQAQEALLREVMDYLQQNGENLDDASAILKDQMVTITIQRGDKFRAFVYIDKQFGKDGTEVNAPAEQASATIMDEIKSATPSVVEQESSVATVTVETHEVSPKPEAVTETPMAEQTTPWVDSSTETILQQIGSMTTRLQVYDFITQLQKDGEKVTFATHPQAEELESMYVLLYKRGGTIEAILTPPDAQGQRYNLATGLPDTQVNHPATSVNGFKLNK